ncbi:hypothetical protein GE061_002888 [Apolygus lucorum]|uniref:Uncharacterized protein n=1 Tax=Apolygus lucorum TaxID=248454 RepID=A0A8S9X0G8_APOLU|nr:hypothetical protein GE061_002888 [Apolygus lucorum]
MKVYDDECRMWTCRNNVVMVLGGHLVVAPFRLDTVKLASLIGVDKALDTNKENGVSIMDNSVEGITSFITQMKEEGHIEHFICDAVFEELLESKNIEGLNAALDNIADIPDKWLVQLANFAAVDEKLLRRVLKLPLSGDASTQTLVRQKLMLTSALKLISVITGMLKEDDVDKCIIDWACLLCDTHYLQCLLSKDDQVISATRDLHDAVEEHIEKTE